MSKQSGKKYFLARKKAKAYMSGVFEVKVRSITTLGVQTLCIDTADAAAMEGKHLGRKLGFPTVNQPLPAGQCMPPPAVYAAWIKTPDGVWRMGVCNIGAQPTVQGSVPLAETYILDYRGDLYGQVLRLAPWHRLRDIQKFESVEELRREVLFNADQARQVLDR